MKGVCHFSLLMLDICAVKEPRSSISDLLKKKEKKRAQKNKTDKSESGINTLFINIFNKHAIHCPSPKLTKDQRRLHWQGRQRKVHDGLETAR